MKTKRSELTTVNNVPAKRVTMAKKLSKNVNAAEDLEKIDFSQYELVDELDKEEMEGFRALQAGNYTLRTDLATKKKYAEIFKEANRRSKAISLRIQERDYIGIRERAIELGIPYQSLINSLIHRYLTGELKANF